ncbi:MAG TPA: hypothetical protein VF225_05280 [Gaiellaceae bacterium]
MASETWRDADLLELDAATAGAAVAFSSDPQLAAFLQRLAKHRAAKETKSGHLFAADLFDAVESIRRYGPNDRLSLRLVEYLASTTENILASTWNSGAQGTTSRWRTNGASMSNERSQRPTG